MDQRPLASGIIIFFNGERFLEEAVESVFAQSYSNWELVLVDDGSSDGSSEMARRFASLHPDRVSYVEHPGHENRGMSASRNLGIRMSRGAFVGFLDADDAWIPSKLEKQIGLLLKHPEAGMVYGRTQLWYSWSGSPKDENRDTLTSLEIRSQIRWKANTVIWPPRFLALLLQRKIASPTMSSMLLRREAIEASGGFEDSFRDLHEDQVFVAKLGLHVPVLLSDEVTDRYRQHQESCCSIASSSGRRLLAAEKYLDWIESYLDIQDVKDSQVWQALDEARWFRRHHTIARIRRTAQRLAARIRRSLTAGLEY